MLLALVSVILLAAQGLFKSQMLKGECTYYLGTLSS